MSHIVYCAIIARTASGKSWPASPAARSSALSALLREIDMTAAAGMM
jgi:hypothetical protein